MDTKTTPDRIQWNIEIDADQAEELKADARTRDRSAAWVTREAIRQYLNRRRREI